MRFINLEGELIKDDEVVNSVMRDIEDCINEGVDEIKIYVQSSGGDYDEAIKLAHYINLVEEKGLAQITLYGGFRLLSAGLLLFLITRCTHKEILPHTGGMIHLGDRYVRAKESKRYGTQSKHDLDELERINISVRKVLGYCQLSYEYMERLDNDEDVYLTTDELDELIKASDNLEVHPFRLLYQ